MRKIIKAGMRVRIRKNLGHSKTHRQYGLDDHIRDSWMVKMGKSDGTYMVKSVSTSGVSVKVDCPEAGRSFFFHTEDVFPADPDKLSPLPKPELFDISQLDI